MNAKVDAIEALTDEEVNAILSGLITFTVEDVEYQAEEGMTWWEWVNSDYNTTKDEEIYNINCVGGENDYARYGGTPLETAEENISDRTEQLAKMVIQNGGKYIVIRRD